MIKGRSTDEIRGIVNISADFTSDEEHQVQQENKWKVSPVGDNMIWLVGMQDKGHLKCDTLNVTYHTYD